VEGGLGARLRDVTAGGGALGASSSTAGHRHAGEQRIIQDSVIISVAQSLLSLTSLSSCTIRV